MGRLLFALLMACGVATVSPPLGAQQAPFPIIGVLKQWRSQSSNRRAV